MTVTLSDTARAARRQVVIDLVDGKSPTATGPATAGRLVIGTSALAGETGVLVEIPLAVPSFTESGGVLTLAGLPLSARAVAEGEAARAEVRSSDGTTIVPNLTVGTSEDDPPHDIVMGTKAVTVGLKVIVTAGALAGA